MIISGLVPSHYLTIQSAIVDMVSIGEADSSITEFYVYTAPGYYNETLNISVPNSGAFYILGSNSYFVPNDTCVIAASGGSFHMNNFTIIGDTTSSYLFNVDTNSTLVFDKTTVVGGVNIATYNSGTLIVNKSTIGGSNSGLAFNGYNTILHESCISDFATGVASQIINANSTNIFGCTEAIRIYNSGMINMNRSLLHTNQYGIVKADSTYVSIEKSTISGTYPIYGSGGQIFLDSVIMDSPTYCINGYLASGSIVNNCCLYQNSWDDLDLVNVPTYTNVSVIDPAFNDTSVGDFRLKFDYVNGSRCVTFTPKDIPSGVSFRVETSNISFNDYRGNILDESNYRFLYKQNNTLLYSALGKEIEHAYYMARQTPTRYSVNTQVVFDVYEQPIQSCFNKNGIHPHPYDWDLKKFNSPEIVKTDSDLEYIIPRSYLDLKPILDQKLNFLNTNSQIRYDLLNKSRIKIYNKEDTRGVTYDYDLSAPGQARAWIVEGRNQLLYKQDAYSAELTDEYPLLCPDMQDNTITQVSGLIYVGPYNNKYRFIDQTDPNINYISESDKAFFKWIDTTMNPQVDLRGILAYKGNLFVTGTRYSEDIYDRTIIPERGGAGILLRYTNDNKFQHYLVPFESMDSRQMNLIASNYLPTDITVYEDGTILIADYINLGVLFRYKLAYDYALIQDNYDKLSRVVLREYYPNIKF